MRYVLAVFLLACAMPTLAETVCTNERYIFGDHMFPSHEEALAQCRQEEAEMTSADHGAFGRVSGCRDAGDPGQHGEWTYGRVEVDVVARESGEPYTYEGLWMCKQAEVD